MLLKYYTNCLILRVLIYCSFVKITHTHTHHIHTYTQTTHTHTLSKLVYVDIEVNILFMKVENWDLRNKEIEKGIHLQRETIMVWQ